MNLSAVITAAAPNQRHLLHQTLARPEGRLDTLGEFALELLFPPGRERLVNRVAFVIAEGETPRFEPLRQGRESEVVLIEQKGPPGYVNALMAARDFAGNEPFLHMVGDHFYLGHQEPAWKLAEQLIATFRQEGSSVSAVQPTRESMLPFFGAVAGAPRPSAHPLYVVETVLEKPTPTEAEQKLIVPGLRSGHYLCFFGLHVFTPALFQLLDREIAQGRPPRSLSDALQLLARQDRLMATVLPGTRFDLGARYGILQAQLALGLQGPDREEILTLMLELLAR